MTATDGVFSGELSAGQISGSFTMSGNITLDSPSAYIRSASPGDARFLLIRDGNNQPKLQFDDDITARMELTKDSLSFYDTSTTLRMELSSTSLRFFDSNANFAGSLFGTNSSGTPTLSLGDVAGNNTANLEVTGSIQAIEGGITADDFVSVDSVGSFYFYNLFFLGAFRDVCRFESEYNYSMYNNENSQDGAHVFTSGGVVLGYLDWVGDWYINGDYKKTSDIKLKKNIKNIDLNKSYELLHNIDPKYFKRKNTNKPSYGFIAQDVQEYDDDNVFVSQGDYLSLDYDAFIPLLFNLVKNLDKRIKNLEDMIE